ncbi:MAG: acyltransferase domain-containing protein [Casimicrobiaceae bacterium]
MGVTEPASMERGLATPLVIAAETQQALREALDARCEGGTGPWRIVVFDPTAQRLATAAKAVATTKPRHGRDGIFFSPGGLLSNGGKLAFLFPGVEARFAPEIDDIAVHFGLPKPDLRAPDLARHGLHVIQLNLFLERITRLVGLRPDMVAGHSIGEWSGMIATGMFEDAALEAFMAKLAPEMLQVADVTYVAAGAGIDRMSSVIGGLPGLELSHDNCNHQSIVCGRDVEIAELQRRLREQRILHEVLPFQSGFHTSALAAHRDYYDQWIAPLALRAPSVPLWSATTCAPYPTQPQAIKALYLDHLTKPVRFRELLLALHDHGARVFVQVGTGSLAAFVDDTLADRPHHAISLLAPQRSGMAHPTRALAALLIEGAPVDLTAGGLAVDRARRGPDRARPLTFDHAGPRARLDPVAAGAVAAAAAARPSDPVYEAFAANMREVALAQEVVHRAFLAARSASASARANARSDLVELSLATYPELRDHSLIPQPPGWPVLTDVYPAVPMTMSIVLLMEAARRLDPERTPVAVEDVLASAWLYVEPPSSVAIASTRAGDARIHVSIDGFFEGTVALADRYPPPPPPLVERLENLRAFPVDVERIYADGYLFHGPRYQGVQAVSHYGSNGLRGTLRALPAKGALLDAAGQLYGIWVMTVTETDRLVMPVRVRRIEFFGPEPPAGASVECTVLVRSLKRREVSADIELVYDGRVYARVIGWEDWRFETGGGVYDLMLHPDEHLLASFDPLGCAMMADPGWRSSTVDLLARRFFSSAELAAIGGLRALQRRRDWLCGRIAAKDAVRRHLRERGGRPLFPIEVTIVADEAGRPCVANPAHPDLRVSIAHKDGIGWAIVAEGADPGIDIERIAERDAEFTTMAFAPGELALLPAGDRDEWITRFWTAKEAAGKAAGTGLAGNPRRLTVTDVAQERVQVNDRWVATRKAGDYIVASTLP